MICVKKYFFCVLFFTALLINVYATARGTIRVGLYYGQSAPRSVTVNRNGQDITISKEELTGEISFYPEEDDGEVMVNGTPYKGGIIITPDSSGNMTVINEVNIEDYVSSVTAKEMSPGFEIEALKAQAVCARTYAMASPGRHSMFDVCASTHCQVYGGAACADDKTARAARETQGEILTYQGKMIETVYFATSGGHTESAEYIWGTAIPYLTGVPDEYESSDSYLYRWTRELSPRRAAEIMQAKGYDVGNVISIEVVQQTQNGVVYKLKVTGDKGEKTFTNEGCRIIFGDILPSQAYSVTADTGVELSTLSGKRSLSGAYILSGAGISRHSGTDVYLKGATDRKIAAAGSSGSFIFSGRGNGHLVGMSQNGANGMAKAGFTYDKILTHYYSGTEITDIENSGIQLQSSKGADSADSP